VTAPLLALRDVVKHFPAGRAGWFARPATVHAVNGVSLEVGRGETVAVVGESGCGKTTLARLAVSLYAPDAGRVSIDGTDVTGLGAHALKPYRRRVQMIFQDPYGSLNPRLPVSAILAEPLVIHGLGARAERRRRVEEAAQAVALQAGQLDRYPHEFSGGQRQRIAIARALIVRPELLVADEPLSALDVSIQVAILDLFRALKRDFGIALLFISHDLAVVDLIADRIAVMYLGHIVETAARADLFRAPAHPYTRALIAAVPAMGHGKRARGGPKSALKGDVPDPIKPPPGCPFHPRCPRAEDLCRRVAPMLDPVAGAGAGHRAACHFRDEVAAMGAP
jgi:oligopeptide transport system ATP-binding protein/dipeptide transport system ATP-binding protein